jgi:hypothetical protein
VTDYLEALEQGDADALWQAEQSLRTALAGAEQRYFAENGEEKPGAERLVETETVLGNQDGGDVAEELLPQLDPETGVDETLPLWQAVRSMEAAENAFLAARNQRSEEEAEYSWTERPALTRTGESGRRSLLGFPALESRETAGNWAERTEMSAGESYAMGRSDRGEDVVRAERVDQAFRRDSRRYDGGFFLY